MIVRLIINLLKFLVTFDEGEETLWRFFGIFFIVGNLKVDTMTISIICFLGEFVDLFQKKYMKYIKKIIEDEEQI